ncbi:hypothetical protein N9263_01640, partial [Candidatus Marinimicrobia bacterium]|nr:hypothetical protein [Candidatus Neomarinimicrobiota bacterium]
FDSTMIQISINEIDVIYVGIGETFEQIRSRWGLGFALAAIPGSFMMANTGPEPQVGSRGFGALISWGLLGSMSYLFCGNLFGGIDYSIKINKSEKFIIGSDYWVIKKNSSKSQPRLGRW